MKFCPKCQQQYTDAVGFCPRDGEVLEGAQPNLAGQVLDGQYEVESLITQSTPWTVYRARHILLGDRVAIKVLSPQMRNDAEWLRRFRREGQTARRFRHPNAVTVYDLRTTNEGLIYMVMEYVEGQTLDKELKRRGRFSPAEALAVLEPVADVLDAAHARGVIHRDLKPENIMLRQDEPGRMVVKVLDLGIAKVTGAANAAEGGDAALTAAGQILSTPYYMSPELWGEVPRAGNSEIDRLTDIYSLGVIFYELLAGRKPRDGRTLVEIRNEHVNATLTLLDDVAPDVPAGFARAVERAMAKDRNDRYPTASELVDDLRRSLNLPARSKQHAVQTHSPTGVTTALDTVAPPLGNLPHTASGDNLRLTASGASDSDTGELAACAQAAAPGSPFRVEPRPVSEPRLARRSGGLSSILLLPFGVLAAGVNLVANAAEAAWQVGQQGKEKLTELAARASDKLFAAKHDDVTCTVFAPPSARPGNTVMVQVFAHLKGQDETVQSYAKKFDPSADIRGRRGLSSAVGGGATLAFHLRMPGLIVDEPDQEITWRGEAESVQFGVAVPGGCEPGDIIGTVTVTQESVPIGHIKFKFTVAPRAGKQVSYPVDSSATNGEFVRYRLAFISYASQDRQEVLKRVQMLDRAHIKYFQDVLQLEPGERWEKEIYKHIDDCDVFFLFWSRAAKMSSWVRREALYAHARKKGVDDSPPEIVPVIIEGPPPAPPPEELSFLHFNDKFIYFINVRDV